MSEIQPYLIYVAAGVAFLVVLAIVSRLFRRQRKSARGGKGERLGINEYYEIDETRRLVLLRRDNVEHLILIGGPQDMVIESGIGAPARASHPVDVALAEVARQDDVVPFRSAPRPPVFGAKRPSLRTVEDLPEGNGPKPA